MCDKSLSSVSVLQILFSRHATRFFVVCGNEQPKRLIERSLVIRLCRSIIRMKVMVMGRKGWEVLTREERAKIEISGRRYCQNSLRQNANRITLLNVHEKIGRTWLAAQSLMSTCPKGCCRFNHFEKFAISGGAWHSILMPWMYIKQQSTGHHF